MNVAEEFERVSRELPPEAVEEVLRAMSYVRRGPLEAAAFARAMRALAEGFEYLSREQLLAAVSEDRDEEVFGLLVSAGLLGEASGGDPLSHSKLRGMVYRRSLLEEAGGAFGVGEVERLLGISRSAVDKRRGNGKLLAVNLGRHGWRYPAFQFDEGVAGGVLEGLEDALAALEAEDGWVALHFFFREDERLGRKPAESLSAGDVEGVVEAAASYGEQVAK